MRDVLIEWGMYAFGAPHQMNGVKGWSPYHTTHLTMIEIFIYFVV
jgi:hypothetical protein